MSDLNQQHNRAVWFDIPVANAKTRAHGGNVIEEIHSIGPHGFRAIILDSEGNRMVLHSGV